MLAETNDFKRKAKIRRFFQARKRGIRRFLRARKTIKYPVFLVHNIGGRARGRINIESPYIVVYGQAAIFGAPS